MRSRFGGRTTEESCRFWKPLNCLSPAGRITVSRGVEEKPSIFVTEAGNVTLRSDEQLLKPLMLVTDSGNEIRERAEHPSKPLISFSEFPKERKYRLFRLEKYRFDSRPRYRDSRFPAIEIREDSSGISESAMDKEVSRLQFERKSEGRVLMLVGMDKVVMSQLERVSRRMDVTGIESFST